MMADAENKRKCFRCGCSFAKDNIKLFRFPKPAIRNLVRCALWAKYIFPEREYSSTTFQAKLHSEHRMLCQKHFKDEDFTDVSKTKLLRTAVPSDSVHELPITASGRATAIPAGGESKGKPLGTNPSGRAKAIQRTRTLPEGEPSDTPASGRAYAIPAAASTTEKPKEGAFSGRATAMPCTAVAEGKLEGNTHSGRACAIPATSVSGRATATPQLEGKPKNMDAGGRTCAIPAAAVPEGKPKGAAESGRAMEIPLTPMVEGNLEGTTLVDWSGFSEARITSQANKLPFKGASKSAVKLGEDRRIKKLEWLSRKKLRRKMEKESAALEATPQVESLPSTSKEPARRTAETAPSKETGVTPWKGKGEARMRGNAEAKRARPDETSSPKVEPKKLKLSQSRGPKPTSYAAAAASKQYAIIEIAITTLDRRFMSREMAAKVEVHIDQHIDEVAVKNIDGPEFDGPPRFEAGSLRLLCRNEKAVQWVKTCLASFSGEEALTVLRPEDIPERVRVGIVLPTVETDRTLIGQRLNICNRWAQIPKWLMHGLHQQENTGRTFLTLSIPEEIVPEILARQRKLSYRLGAVYVVFRNATTGSYVRHYPGLSGNQEEVSEPEATSTPEGKSTDPELPDQPIHDMDLDKPREDVEEEEELLGLNSLVLEEQEECPDGSPL